MFVTALDHRVGQVGEKGHGEGLWSALSLMWGDLEGKVGMVPGNGYLRDLFL